MSIRSLDSPEVRVFVPAMRFASLCLFAGLALAAPARAQQTGRPASSTPATPAVTSEQATRTLDILKDDKRRAALIETLETIANAEGRGAPSTIGSASPAKLPLEPGSLGAQLIVQISAAVGVAGTQLMDTLRSVNDLPLLWRWLSSQAADPAARAAILDALWKMLVVLGAAVAAEYGGKAVLRRVRAAVSHAADATALPDTQPGQAAETGLAAAEAGESERSARQRRLTRALSALRRVPYLLGRLALDLIPIAVFALVGHALLGTTLGEPERTRLAILAVIEAYVATRMILAGTAMLISPVSPRLRLLHVTDWAAAFLTRWIRRVVATAIAGYALAEVGLLFGMYRTAYETLLKLFALVIHVGLVVAVLQAQEPVARRIRARHDAKGAWAVALNRFSEVWHLVAVFYIVALWLVWAIELRNGYVRLIRFFLISAGVLLAARLVAIFLLGGFDRLRIGPQTAARHPGMEARLNAYYPYVRGFILGLVWVVTIFALLEFWGLGVIGWLQYTGLGARTMSAVTLIGATTLVAILFWEGVNAWIELHLVRLDQQAQLARAGRLRTLLPMLRTTLLGVILLVVTLTVLSELGVNIAPLLAGAGVVGIAVGFGSQKLVQDLITGLFLLLENAMQVGDVVTLGGLSGTVEALSIRTIRLRALDGSVHIIPFSAVTTVTNQTRDYGYAVLDVSIGLNEEPDHISTVLKEVAEDMRGELKWSTIVLEPLDVMGVEKFVDTAWVLRVRVKTQPSSRWSVGRELNRRIKLKFDELAIESPFTSHRVLSMVPAPVPLGRAATPQENAA